MDIGSLNKEFDPDSAEIVKGRAIREKPVSIGEAVMRLGEKLVVVGDIFASEMKELRNEKVVATFDITDYSGSLKVKIFASAKEIEDMNLGSLKKGTTLLVAGKIDYDSYAHDIVVSPYSLIKVKRIPKMDNYPEKRVELHCHTNMSAMDAVNRSGKHYQQGGSMGTSGNCHYRPRLRTGISRLYVQYAQEF